MENEVVEEVIQLTPQMLEDILQKVSSNDKVKNVVEDVSSVTTLDDIKTILFYIFFALCFIAGAILFTNFIKGWNSKI